MATITALRKYTTMLVLIVSVLTASCTKDSPNELVLTEEPAEEQEPAEQPEEPFPPEKPAANITMTTLATEVGFYMRMKSGADSIVIDWGDGEGSKTYAPDGSGSYIGSYSFSYLSVSHSYSAASEHHITIAGDSIVYLDCRWNSQITTLDVSRNTALKVLWCSSNQLTALDVSRNTALRELYCYKNQLTVSALNDLFRALPNSVGYIVVWYNPGENDCDYSIAQENP